MGEEIVTNRHDEAVTTSMCVAQMFGKQHFHVIRDIENLISDMLGDDVIKQKSDTLADESNASKFGFVKKYFIKSYYYDKKHERRPMYYMTRDGFTLLAMGFTGKRAMEWKIKYINAFNTMEQYISNIKADKLLQKSSMQFLKDNLSMPEGRDYQKANTIANKAVSNLYGLPKMVKKEEMTEEMLSDREPVLNDVVQLMAVKEKFGLDISVSKTIYQKYAR